MAPTDIPGNSNLPFDTDTHPLKLEVNPLVKRALSKILPRLASQYDEPNGRFQPGRIELADINLEILVFLTIAVICTFCLLVSPFLSYSDRVLLE